MLSCLFVLPVASLVVQALLYPFRGYRLPEHWNNRLVLTSNGMALLANLWLLLVLRDSTQSVVLGTLSVTISYGNAILSGYSLLILVVVHRFSTQYLHREIGYYKLFLNFGLFWVGQMLFIWTDGPVLGYAGWELIGISSIFLISFYDYRRGPIDASLYVLVFYKIADVLLLGSLVFLHSAGARSDTTATGWALGALILAGLIKSGSFPFSTWLPRAMEGPTPSSAVFYGALSVNTGVILLLKHSEQFQASSAMKAMLLAFGILTIIYSRAVASVQTDAKNSLVYATSAQLGFIVVEVGLGLNALAIFHMTSNGLLKTYQFLRTPSYLRVFNEMEGSHGEPLTLDYRPRESIFPPIWRLRLYKLAYYHFYMDQVFQLIARSVLYLGRVAKTFVDPMISFADKRESKILLWGLYYLLAAVAFELNLWPDSHSSELPIVILCLVALAMVPVQNAFHFIALTTIYKIVELAVMQDTHLDEPLGLLNGSLCLTFFALLYVKRRRGSTRRTLSRLIQLNCLILIMMLQFTNFPFLLQGLFNEHIMVQLVESGRSGALIRYGVANMFFNIGVYLFVFKFVYLNKDITAYVRTEEQWSRARRDRV